MSREEFEQDQPGQIGQAEIPSDQMRACATCRYSTVERMPPPLIQTVRVCRRMPPLITVVPTPDGLGLNTQFPIVHDALWCYEYAPDAPANA